MTPSRHPARTSSRPRAAARLGLVLALVSVVAPGCSIKKVAIGSLADTLAASGDTFAADDDPELIRLAVPFSLKTIESLLVEVPNHPGLLLAACSGFTQYSYAFVQTDAEYEEPVDFERSQDTRLRARRMYQRATGYCLRRLEVTYPGIEKELRRDPTAALAKTKKEDVPALYWTAASWGSAISLGLDQPELIADLPTTRALMERALALDESWSQGAIHAAMISIESVPEAMGGSTKRARDHFARAVELSEGESAGPYVTLAASVSQPAQDRAEFERLLNEALAIDADKYPSWRLANLITQKRARFLLSRVDSLFNEPEPPPTALGTGFQFLPSMAGTENQSRPHPRRPSLEGFASAGVGLVPRASNWLRVEGPRSGGSSWVH